MSRIYSQQKSKLSASSGGKGTVAGPFLLFAIEGALFQFITSFNGFANNLFAVGIGASDAQIGLTQTVANGFALILLLPLGILADKLRSSRTIPFVTLLCMAAGFLLMSAVPMMNEARFVFFYMALAFTLGGPAIYNAQWKNFFGDVIEADRRNIVLARRSRWMYVIGIGAPLLCALLMKNYTDNESKLRFFQFLYFFCALVMIAQAFVVHRIETPVHEAPAEKESFGDLKGKIETLLHNKAFMGFFIPISIFYMAWQLDWSVWFIGQVQYVGLNDAQITLFNGIFSIGQLVAVTIFARIVQRRSPDFVLLFGCISLSLCPLIMIFSMRLPETAPVMLIFTLLCTVVNASECSINLCVVQVLLRVAPRKCRSIGVSLHTFVITLTNSLMPLLGVKLYTALGADFSAMTKFMLIALAARGTAALLLIRRYIKVKNEVEPRPAAAVEG